MHIVLYVHLFLLLHVPMANKSCDCRRECTRMELVGGANAREGNITCRDRHTPFKSEAASGAVESQLPSEATKKLLPHIYIHRNPRFKVALAFRSERSIDLLQFSICKDLNFNADVMVNVPNSISTLVPLVDMVLIDFELPVQKQFSRLHSRTLTTLSFLCEQSKRQNEKEFPNAEDIFISHTTTDMYIFFDVYLIEVAYSSCEPTWGPHSEPRCPLSKRVLNVTESHTLPNRTLPLEWTDGGLEDPGLPPQKHFPRFPFWSKIFSSQKLPDKNFSNTSNIVSNLINNYFTNLLILVMCLISFLYKLFLSHAQRTKIHCSKSVDSRCLSRSFSLMKGWNASFKVSWKTDSKDASEHYHTRSSFATKSAEDILNQYIFRPWLRKVQPQCSETCFSFSNPKACATFESSPCSSCLEHLDNFRVTHNHHVTLQVSPVTSFLPNATRNPALDLAHVGYRLATLSALPASVPTSRIKLADAGFYFRGQGDEVICYSCGARHSGWTREDNPLEIHRRHSPECQHVLIRDREAGARANPETSTPAASIATRESEIQAQPQAPDNDPDEDGGNSSTASRPHAAPCPQTQASERRVVSNGSLSASDVAGPTTESLVISGAAASERTTSTLTRTTESHRETMPTTGSDRAPNGATSAGSPARDISGTLTNGEGNARTSQACVSSHVTNSRPSASTSPSSGSHGNPPGAEARPLFPRAGLDLGGAVYPMYQDMASRRRTFSQWDDSQAPPLDHVILSGMFYAGYADCVRCFYCGVGLKHWVPTDDVWTEHVRWRPGCEYLRAVKGDDFIRETQQRLGIEPGSTGQNRGSNNRSDAAPRQQQPQPTTTTTTSSTPVTASTSAAATTTSANSQESMSASTHSGSGQTSRTSTATPTTRGTAAAAAEVATSGTTASSTRPSSPRTGGSGQGGANRAGASLAPSAAEERERLSRLQAENRALSQRLRCRACRQAAIDTILMPCGHLVLCESCAGSVTSCPLCHDHIRATAKVHMA